VSTASITLLQNFSSSTDYTGIIVLDETQVIAASYSSGIFIFSLAPTTIALHTVLFSGTGFLGLILPVLFSSNSVRGNTGLAVNSANSQFVNFTRTSNVWTTGNVIFSASGAMTGAYSPAGNYLVLAAN
jgi:hypothetical protein